MREVVLVSACRTPVGKHSGVLSNVRVDDMAILVLKELMKRANVDPIHVEDAIVGCVNMAGEANGNLARNAILMAEFPFEVAGTTVNRFCGSSLSAFNHAVHAIAFGAGDAMIAAGAESMTRSVWVVPKFNVPFPRGPITLGDTFMSGGGGPRNPIMEKLGLVVDMATTAQNVANKYGISREAMDEFAVLSHQKATKATKEGKFKAEMVPVSVPQRKGPAIVVDVDESIRMNATIETMAALPPAFPQLKDITAGNASPMNDGASAALIMSAEKAKELKVKPMARILSTAVAGLDPRLMGLGPAYAIPKALKRAGLTLDQMDLIEINEAFAAQVLGCTAELKPDMSRLNVNGGAIALGHALGNSGVRLINTLAYELERRQGRYGVASLCIGGGQGIATVIERIP